MGALELLGARICRNWVNPSAKCSLFGGMALECEVQCSAFGGTALRTWRHCSTAHFEVVQWALGSVLGGVTL